MLFDTKTRVSLKYFVSYCRLAYSKWRTISVSILHKSKKSKKQPYRGVLKKRSPENMQQIYRRTPMSKCDFNKVVKQLYWNHTSPWVFFCKCAAYFQKTFLKNTSGWLLLKSCFKNLDIKKLSSSKDFSVFETA